MAGTSSPPGKDRHPGGFRPPTGEVGPDVKDFCRTVLRSNSKARLPAVEELYPAVAQFVRGGGWIEIGDQQGVGLHARALDYGGLVFEDMTARSLGEALAALDRGLEDSDSDR